MLNDFNCSCPVYIACGYTDLRRVRDESDYTAGSVYGPRDLIGNIVEYSTAYHSAPYIRVKCNDFSFVVTAGNTIESDRIDQSV